MGRGFRHESPEQRPFVYSAGLGYDVSSQVFLGVEAEKTEGWQPGINAVIQYHPADKLVARLVSAYADVYNSPFLRYRVSSHARGRDFLVRVS